MSGISVLVPTHNRPDALKLCLDALFRPPGCKSLAQVVVVDDGSRPDTFEVLRPLHESGVLTALRNESPMGPAHARNRGIERIDSEYTLIIGDDVILESDALTLFEQHLNRFDMTNASVIGNIQPWPERMTAFEYWNAHGGSQFNHTTIPEEKRFDAGRVYFYTCNIVCPTALLRAYPFDESFRYARYEDRELGYRLERETGHKIHYLPEARSLHRHKTPFKTWLAQLDRFAAAALHFASLYPEDAELRIELGITRAAELKGFSLDYLESAVDLLNAFSDRFFAPASEYGQLWANEVVKGSFQCLQCFFRSNHLRRHCGLEPLRDDRSGLDAQQAMNLLLARMKDEL